MIFRRKEQAQAEDDGSMPMLVELAYNVTSQPKGKHLPRKESLPKLESSKMLHSSVKPQKGQKLVISNYEPNRNQIKVSNWRKFNDLICERKPSE
jgi:hypothetical protein